MIVETLATRPDLLEPAVAIGRGRRVHPARPPCLPVRRRTTSHDVGGYIEPNVWMEHPLAA